MYERLSHSAMSCEKHLSVCSNPKHQPSMTREATTANALYKFLISASDSHNRITSNHGLRLIGQDKVEEPDDCRSDGISRPTR